MLERQRSNKNSLLWNKKPIEFALSDIDDIAVKLNKDAMSGASIHHSVLHRRTGEVTVLTTEEAKDAAETVEKLRGFIGPPLLSCLAERPWDRSLGRNRMNDSLVVTIAGIAR